MIILCVSSKKLECGLNREIFAYDLVINQQETL